MEKQIKAALVAARAYKVRNEGERSSVELIVAMLEDAARRCTLLDGFAEAYDKQQAVRGAEEALAKAQAAV